MANEEVLKLAAQHPDWLWIEYDIVQHALIDDDDKGLASFAVTYDNDYKLQFISLHPYGTTATGTETLTIRSTNGIEILNVNKEYEPASTEVLEFFKVFETYFDKAVVGWLK